MAEIDNSCAFHIHFPQKAEDQRSYNRGIRLQRLVVVIQDAQLLYPVPSYYDITAFF